MEKKMIVYFQPDRSKTGAEPLEITLAPVIDNSYNREMMQALQATESPKPVYANGQSLWACQQGIGWRNWQLKDVRSFEVFAT